MRSSKAAALLFVALALGASPAGAAAEDSKTFFAQGRKLRADGDCDGAIVAFRRALEVDPQGLGALRNIAECEEQLGQYASARNDWWSLRRAVLQSNEPKYEGWDKAANEGYDRLAARVAKITVRIQAEAPDRVRVTIDGKPLDPRLVGVELERDLGLHTVQANYGGAAPVTEKRTLAAGAHEVVTLVIPNPKPGEKAPDGPPPIPADEGRPGLRAAGFAAIGAGGLAAVGAIVSVVIRQSALSTVTGYCPDAAVPCSAPQAAADAVDRGKTASTLVNVFSGVAVAGVGAGIALVVVGGRSAAPPKGAAAAAFFGAGPAPGGGRLWAEVRF